MIGDRARLRRLGDAMSPRQLYLLVSLIKACRENGGDEPVSAQDLFVRLEGKYSIDSFREDLASLCRKEPPYIQDNSTSVTIPSEEHLKKVSATLAGDALYREVYHRNPYCNWKKREVRLLA